MSELAIFDEKKLNAVALFTSGGADPFIEQLKKKVKEFEPDLTSEKGRKEIKSFAYKIAQTKTKLDEMGASLNEKKLAEIKLVNAERARIKEQMQALQDEVRAPVTQWEEVEKQRLELHKQCLVTIESRKDFCDWQSFSVSQIQTAINSVNDHFKRDWQEFEFQALKIKNQVIEDLNKALESRKKYDAEQLELERFRKAEEERKQKEHEEKIAIEAAQRAKAEAEKIAAQEKAKAEAEQAEYKRLAEERERKIQEEKIQSEKRAIAAEEAIKQSKIDSDRREKEALAKAKADREAVVKRLQEAAAQEKRKTEEAIQKREADKRHTDSVENEAARALATYININLTDCRSIIKSIALGKIPNVKINY